MVDLFSPDNKGIFAIIFSGSRFSNIEFLYFDLPTLSSSMRSLDALSSFVSLYCSSYVDVPSRVQVEFHPCSTRLMLSDFRKFPLTTGYFRGKCTRNLLHSGSL